jgi:hypothetical protein
VRDVSTGGWSSTYVQLVIIPKAIPGLCTISDVTNPRDGMCYSLGGIMTGALLVVDVDHLP